MQGYLLHLKISLLVNIQKSFMLLVNLPENLVWVTLSIFLVDLEGTAIPFILHRESPNPGSVEKRALISLFFGKNPRPTLCPV